MLSKSRRYPYGRHGRTAHQDMPSMERIPRRPPNPSPRKLEAFENRVSTAEGWILQTIEGSLLGAFCAVSEGHALDILDKEVRPGNTRLGHGKERRKVLLQAFKNLMEKGRIIHVEDRATYGTVAA